jgi:LPXTG-motif cell wall-anchored protein
MLRRVRRRAALRRLALAALPVLLLAAAAPAAASGPAAYDTPKAATAYAGASAIHTVSIVDFAFDPTDLSVNVGDTVQWINNGTAEEGHNVIGEGLQSPTLHTGESYSFTFNAAGTYSYECTIHPKMKATLEVVDPNAKQSKQPKKSKAPSHKKKSSSSPAASGGGSSGSASSAGAAPAASAGSESAAVDSSGAGGSNGSLPSTGSNSPALLLAGLALLGCGLAMRVRLRRGPA